MTILNSVGKYPALTDLINSGGRLYIGYIDELQISAIVVDEGGTIWEGKEEYESLEAALEDAEKGVAKWFEENW